jgi:glucosylceramidase
MTCISGDSLARLLRSRIFILAVALLRYECVARVPPPAPEISVEVFRSSADLKERLQLQPALKFVAPESSSPTITVDDTHTFQQMDGFGASFTDSSAWLIFNKLSASQRTDVMEKLFDPIKGIGLSFLRQPMGASDFALTHYSYDDLPNRQSDPDLVHFSIDHDRKYILPLLRQARALNPQLRVMASPWSPPGWMKTSGSLRKGELLPTAYATLARYFVQFVKSYAAEGVPIYAVTMQNEPLYNPDDYPGMSVTAEQQAKFVRDDLGPAFKQNQLDTKIMIFDHNWDLIDFAYSVLKDSAVSAFVAGTALHCYGGSVDAQDQLHVRFPEKDIWQTECSGGDWQTKDLLQEQLGLVIGTTRNWSKSVVLWNLALDQDHGPHLGGCGNCRGVVTVNSGSSPSGFTTTVDYVALGHASKFVVPGAWRIESGPSNQNELQNVAFRNPDGSIVLLVLNSSSKTLSFHVRWSERSFVYTLEAGFAATFCWRPPATKSQR